MGGASTSRFQIITNDGTAISSDLVSLENHGGFASVRPSPDQQNLTGHQHLRGAGARRWSAPQVHRAARDRFRLAALRVRVHDPAR